MVTVIVQISEAAHKSRKSVIRGLPASVLQSDPSVPARGLDPWRRPKGSWALGTRMALRRLILLRLFYTNLFCGKNKQKENLRDLRTCKTSAAKPSIAARHCGNCGFIRTHALAGNKKKQQPRPQGLLLIQNGGRRNPGQRC